MIQNRVVLAMSGGVDSSVSAWLLKREGYEVIGLFMRTGVHSGQDDHRADHKKGCCSAIDAGDARKIADKLDIPFYALDFEEDFNQIIDYFADEYLRGRTPNPCVVCNNWLKFGKLWDFAQSLDANYIATGHYAQVLPSKPKADPLQTSSIENNSGEINKATIDASEQFELHRGVDPEKDQSYVLHGIRREILPHLLFPVGRFTKEQIRQIARDAGLAVANKPDSVEICFVPDGDHARLIRERRPNLQTAGQVVDTNGQFLGDHDGYERFTIGQRKGLKIAGEKKRYVLEILPETKTVVLGDSDGLKSAGLLAKEVNWLIDPPDGNGFPCLAKIRYRHQAVLAHICSMENGLTEVKFVDPQNAITPGQAVVFYNQSRVLGGGWIEKAI